MVSEKKSTKHDIAKVHEFIDNITVPQAGSTASYVEIKQKLLQKKLFDEPTTTTAPTLQEGSKDNLPAWETVIPEARGTKTDDYDKNDEAGLPEFEPVPMDQLTSPLDDDWLTSYDLLEIEVTWETNQGRKEMNQQVSEPVSFEEVPLFEPTPVLEKPTEIQPPEPQTNARKNDRQNHKLLRKELKQKVKRERQAYLKQEKEDRRLKRLEERKRKEGTSPNTPSEKNE
jgi:hypothetical protein